MNMVEDLQRLITGDVSADTNVRTAHSRDASIFSLTPEVVVFPKSSEDIQSLVRFAHERKNVSLTVRSGGTDMSGGPLSESVVINVQKYMNHIKDINENAATVEPGAYYKDFEQETLKHNLLLPTYPASREICTVGGMVNNNAGGEKTLAYGKTEKYVKELKTVLSDGHEYSFSSLTPRELEEKKKLRSFEGDIYRGMFDIVDTNYDLLQKAKPAVSKNSTGYNLWNVWDKRRFDLTQLFTGSQGTLGITTEVTFRLVTPKPHTSMLVIFLNDIEHISTIVQRVLKYQPESFESYDDKTLGIAIKYFPQMMKQLGATNIFALTWQLIPELTMLATSHLPKLILLAEFTGHDDLEVQSRAHSAEMSLRHLNVKTHVAEEPSEIRKYWTIRRESFNLLRKKVKGKHTAPFIDDVCVRPEQLPAFLPRLNDILSDYDITYTIAGHIGDANFHIIPLLDFTKPEQRKIIPELADKVYKLVFEFNGSISGEHNDGLIRSHYLETMYGSQVYSLFAQTKQLFDPHTIFNPGKKIGADWEYAKAHIIEDWT